MAFRENLPKFTTQENKKYNILLPNFALEKFPNKNKLFEKLPEIFPNA